MFFDIVHLIFCSIESIGTERIIVFSDNEYYVTEFSNLVLIDP